MPSQSWGRRWVVALSTLMAPADSDVSPSDLRSLYNTYKEDAPAEGTSQGWEIHDERNGLSFTVSETKSPSPPESSGTIGAKVD
jgi:hypothetical protein